MRVLKRLLIFIAVVLLLVLGAAFVLPDHAQVERRIEVARPASMVLAVVESFTLFNRWSPWAAMDPAATYTYAGPERGEGAKMTWSGNHPDVGSGSQTILSSTADKVVVALEFDATWKATSTTTIDAFDDGKSAVRWSFYKDLPITLDGKFLEGIIGRYYGLAMDHLVGDDYAQGLENLKTLVESMPNADIAGLEASVENQVAQPAYVVPGLEAATDSQSSSAVLGAAYGEIVALAQGNGIVLSGAPYAVINGHGEGKWQFDAGIPVDRNDVEPTGRVIVARTFGGKAVDFRHLGAYDTLSQTHAKAHAWLATRGMEASGNRIEIYVSDPTNTPPEQVLTLVRVPVK